MLISRATACAAALPTAPFSVAIVSDTSFWPGQLDQDAPACGRRWYLERLAALIAALSGVPTQAVLVGARDAKQLADEVRSLPPRIGAVVLQSADLSLAHEAQRMMAGAERRPIITVEDMWAVSLLAATAVRLGTLGRYLSDAHVLIAGAPRVPVLVPLLLAAGTPRITMWCPEDGLPLTRAAPDSDVAINLLGPRFPACAISPARADTSLIATRSPDDRCLALPGLLRAIADFAGQVTTRSPDIDVWTYLRCADGLLDAAEARAHLPSIYSPATTQAVATVVGQALGNRGDVGPGSARCRRRAGAFGRFPG